MKSGSMDFPSSEKFADGKIPAPLSHNSLCGLIIDQTQSWIFLFQK